MRTGPSANPKSRSRFVVALAIPASRIGTVLIETAAIEPTVSAKPQPRISMGAMKRVQLMSWKSSSAG